MKGLEGKAALVTGGARGIGAAIARRLARDGSAVAVNYSKSAVEAEAVAAEINKEGGRAVTVKGDLSDPAQARATGEAAVRGLGGPRILVHNAGRAGFGPAGTVDGAHLH